jgi:hypothetical protein
MDEVSTKIINTAGFFFHSLEELDGLLVDRELLLKDDKYEEVKQIIPALKRELSSTYLTSLQKTAEKKQKWPLLNMIRQILHFYQFDMIPIRKCDGMTLEGKKRYKRLFHIQKKTLNTITNTEKEE